MNLPLTQNLWERFGFRDNPFDTRALSLTPDSRLSVAEAFVGRGADATETHLMTNFLRNPGGGRVVVEGDVGVGKTTFVNYHRYRWENETETNLLTPASEISVQSDWSPREFLVSVLGTLAGRLALTKDATALKKDSLLTEVSALTGVLIRQSLNLSGGISILGFGGSGGKSKSTTVHRGEIGPAVLQDYLQKLINRIRKLGFAGAILHLNNLELLSRNDPMRLRRFFDEIRDYLQTPHLYFIFVGYTGMYQEVIVPVERVRSVFFGHPVYLPPLDLADVHRAIELRYQLLAVRPKQWIRPIDDGLIDYLYKEFSGKIRFIMDAVTTLVSRLPEGATGTLTNQAAQTLLCDLTWERLKPILTDTEQDVLLAAVRQRRFTNSSLVKAVKKSKQNVAKYLKRFQDLNLICQAEKRGRSVYYEISPEVALLQPSKRR